MSDQPTSKSVASWKLAVCCVVFAILGTYLVSAVIWSLSLLAESTAATQSRFWRKALLTLPLRTTLHTASSVIVSALLLLLSYRLVIGSVVNGWRQTVGFGISFGVVCWFLRLSANRVFGSQWFMLSSTCDLICLVAFGMFAASTVLLLSRREPGLSND